MAKLIYAQNKSGFETAYSDLTQTGSVYRSVVFTADGYLWTHGKYFRIFDASNPFDVTYASGINVATGNIVSLRDAAGTVLTTFDIGVASAGGTAPISASVTSGVLSVTHDTSGSGAGTIGAISGTPNTTVAVPYVTYNATGHITTTGSITATLNNVLTNLVTDSTTHYITFATSNTDATTSALEKATLLTYNPGTQTFSAPNISGTLSNKFSLTLNGTLVEYNNSAATTIASLYAPTTSGTSGYLLKSNGDGTAPDWIQVVTSVTAGSTDTQIPTAASVWAAVTSGMAANDAMVFKGTIGVGGTYTVATFNALTTYNAGWTYKVIDAGPVTVKGIVCENGDLVIAIVDRVITGATNSDWTVTQTNLDGAVVASANLSSNQILVGDTGTKTIKTLAAGGDGNMLFMSSGTPTWGAPKVMTFQNNGTTITTFTPGSANTTLNFKAGANVSLTTSGTDLTFASTDTNTATAVDNILHGTNSGTAITYAPYTTVQAFLSFDTSGTTPSLTGRLNLNGYLYATKLFSGGTEVLTAYQTLYGLTFSSPTASGVNGAGNATRITTTYAPATAVKTLNITAGNNVTITSSNDASNHNIVITSTDTNSWRAVNAYQLTNNLLAEILSDTIGTADLQFGSEFLWTTSAELKLGWAEVDATGVVTYAV